MEMRDAYEYKAGLDLERLAWHAANIMNVHLKRPVTVKKLLGKGKKPQTFGDKEQQFAALMEQLKSKSGVVPT